MEKQSVSLYIYKTHKHTHTCVSFLFFYIFSLTKEQRRQNKIYICIGISRVDDLFMIGQNTHSVTLCDCPFEPNRMFE